MSKLVENGKPERRYLSGEVELRRQSNGGPPRIAMFVPFDSRSSVIQSNLGEFREIIRSSAFDKTINDRSDVVSMWNHDPSWVLGRRSNGMLRLSKGDTGVEGEVELDADDPMHRHFARRVERRDVTGTSFVFTTVRDKWNDSFDERELLEVRLMSFDPVTFPAYPESSNERRTDANLDIASVRAGVDLTELVGVLSRLEDGVAAAPDAAILERWAVNLRSYIPGPGRDRLAEARARIESLMAKHPYLAVAS